MSETPSQNKRDVIMDFGPTFAGTGGKSWFFGIGINQYTHFTPLHNAVKDVQDLVKLLQKEYDLDPEQTLALYNEEATRKNIIKMLDRLQREVGPADKLIIYYSGHGHLDKNTNKGYWIPTDAERDNTSEYIRNSTIREYIETLKSLHTLLISDSCFSGSLFVRGASRSTAAVNELAAIPSRWAICSGRHDEEVFDGEPGANSPFAESIMDTLRRNQQKEINVARLVDRVIDQTRSNYQQLPEGNPLYGVGHKGGQYIFNRRADEGEDWAKVTAAATLSGYRQFLENYPSGKHAAEAREKIAFLEEEAAWEKAKAEHTVVAYFEYDQAYPNGRYGRKALAAIAELEEETAWRKAERRDILSDYLEYKDNYPRGKYRAEADARINAIIGRQQEPARWKQTTLRDTPEAYADYLKQYPEGIYAGEARDRLAELQRAAAEKEKVDHKKREAEQKQAREAAAWKTARETATEAGYREFLSAYPKGPFTAQAKAALQELRRAKAAPPAFSAGQEAKESATASRAQSPPPEKPAPGNSLPKWLPMAAGGLALVLVVGWGISKLSGSSSPPAESTASPSEAAVTYTGKTINLNGLTWMAENLNIETPGSWCYDDDPANCAKYGRLYTWEAAKKACASLGSGWRLPTDEEWADLRNYYGGEEKAYEALIKNGSSGFGALLGGYRNPPNGKYYDLGTSGLYWSGTEVTGGYAWYYDFDGSSRQLYRVNSGKAWGRSCRCTQGSN